MTTKKIYFEYGTQYVGQTRSSIDSFEASITDEELDDIAFEYALENASSYGHEDDVEDIWGCWALYDPAKHGRY